MKILCSQIVFLIFVFSFVAAISASSFVNGQRTDTFVSILGGRDIEQLSYSIGEASQAPSPGYGSPASLVLAAKRTRRPDILDIFRRYQGGWDIRNRHYWAVRFLSFCFVYSVGFTGVTGFVLAALWFISFGLALAVHHCCRFRVCFNIKDSKSSDKVCLALLTIFTLIAVIGCIFLWVGQGKFHAEAVHTLNYVVNQSDYTSQILKNVTDYLSLAKSINVAQVFLPSNVRDDIDMLNGDLNNAAGTLRQTTSENSIKIRRVFYALKSCLIVVATVMLVLSVIGLLLTILGHKHAVHIFIIGGWLLVAVTFSLYGGFVIINNAISDTCVAMKEWVDNPRAETALSNILPCVDERTTNHTLMQSKQVITNIINIINQVIYTVANTNPPPGDPKYYNQSGATMPPLCYPFDSNLHDQQCGDLDVPIANASVVWKNYTCEAAKSGSCTSPGRVTPDMYRQLADAVNVTYALQHYAPLLLSLRDCNFVRDTFREITGTYCSPLVGHVRMVGIGLGLVSVGVMLCLVLWILCTNRPRREVVVVDVFRKKGEDLGV